MAFLLKGLIWWVHREWVCACSMLCNVVSPGEVLEACRSAARPSSVSSHPPPTVPDCPSQWDPEPSTVCLQPPAAPCAPLGAREGRQAADQQLLPLPAPHCHLCTGTYSSNALRKFLFWSSLYHLNYWFICNSVHKNTFFSAFFRGVLSFWVVPNHKCPPLWWKIWKIVWLFIYIAQKKGLDALKAMQKKPQLSAKYRFWKNPEKNVKTIIFHKLQGEYWYVWL